MQFKAIIVLALAAAVSAVPAGDLDARTSKPATCAKGSTNTCCDSFQTVSYLGIAVPINLGLNCVINILGTTCANQAACCQTSSSSQNGLVNIGALTLCPNIAA